MGVHFLLAAILFRASFNEPGLADRDMARADRV